MHQFIKHCSLKTETTALRSRSFTLNLITTCCFSRVLVNVVKYKLDHMRRRIEMDERDSTNRASFRCPNCCSTFTDLEANQLFDPMTGKDLWPFSVPLTSADILIEGGSPQLHVMASCVS